MQTKNVCRQIVALKLLVLLGPHYILYVNRLRVNVVNSERAN